MREPVSRAIVYRGLRIALALIGLLALADPASAAVLRVAEGDSAGLVATLAKARAGDEVRLAAGVYKISTALHPKSGTRLIGAGRDSTILRFAGRAPSAILNLTGCDAVEVADMSLDGARDPNCQQGITASDSRRLSLHDLAIRNLAKGTGWGPHGILFAGRNPTRAGGVTDSTIADCLIENIAPDCPWGAGIRLAWGSSHNRVLGNTIRHTGRGGIFADDGSTDLLIRGNTVSGSGGEGLGIEVWGGCDRSVIEDNHLDHWLSIGGCDYCAVRRNVIGDQSGIVKAIGIEGIGNHCVITDNLVDDGQQIGISVSGPAPKNYFLWARDTVRRCIQWAAQFQGEAGGIAYHYFIDCRFDGTTFGRGKPGYPGDEGHGFRTNGNVRHLTFDHCDFSHNARYGLQLGGTGVDFLGFLSCTIRDNGAAAVVGPGDYNALGNPASYSALEWRDCTVEGNKSNALPAARPFATQRPHASFRVPDPSRAGMPVAFVSTSHAAAGAIAAVLWDFGDGPPSDKPTTTHTYASPGAYRVSLVVWDTAGRGALAERLVHVGR